ncbi:hypothetical protein A2697_02355 [Candidatus Curtissbacteria bacterium RIFCSPHIGHO2_01_FULL_41_44]|uniref:Phosphoribosyltransferase domain-containing protein n=1 Tax=Candidatus Curtissbacteria bacterium RIFCSPLOWO2_01_FULL_42_50 TaxID=1797730 RepID=A0A1F5H5F8_9BACT|nr:MAG: hypothetical protein A2697_02355 [Candidatus Curtissbacteria bacterium RIFCSPHIGHO2_01_FULL_41_44]OGD94425.1 MAG: hypothetical protein A3C33_04000 [Candidatus Curtissbacteria bacterium RIFCSPHIGHO2_02_FULL_42_58]OGD97607.1 MAG: hypothetical protein A3E71_05305 [Candidatus Curtissbacteria bacterium RIFCSPHIGHO2_12_FULL_42_33]OGD99299.1 MAG: hypothetical protein A3B54_02855 [Candidatus Curtissbacteria bacterium RIFCSPLOWO2_01_FULL_42_50]OGE02579.1 MAG: hypothetical protein A3G16_03560 [Ca
MVNLLFDFLFPKRCVSCGKFGAYICKGCFSKIEYIEKPVCSVCQRQAIGGKTHPGCRSRYGLDGLVVACRYRGPVKRAITKVKYKWIYDIEKIFVDLTADNLWRFDLPSDLTIVPVPLHSKRKRWRGFNQSEILAKSLAKKFGVDLRDVLIRTRETKSQVGLKRDERKENVKGAFSLNAIQTRFGIASQTGFVRSVEGKNFMLVDDVYTSGATMAECCRVLKKAGARQVWGLTVALG